MKVILLAGGYGTRLWPLSRAYKPKQFINLNHKHSSLLQDTLIRVESLEIDSIDVVCNEEHRFFARDQLNQINKKAKIILEPGSRSTAPAITLSAMLMQEDDLMLVLPADHLINDHQLTSDSVKYAIQYLDRLDVDTGIDLLNMCASQLRYCNNHDANEIENSFI